MLSGCKQSPASSALAADCQNIGSSNGEIESKELTGELGFIKKGKTTQVGVDLKAASESDMAMFECGGANETTGKGTGKGRLRELQGSVIGKAAKLNAMVSENTTTYAVKKGKQVPEAFEGGVKDTLITVVGVEKAGEPTTLLTLEAIKNEEPIEIRDMICNPSLVCET